VAQNTTDDELRLFLYTAQARGLNPLLKQIHCIKRKQKQEDGTYKQVMTIQTGIDGFRLIAQRTRTYAPSSTPVHFEYKNNKVYSCTFYVSQLIPGNIWRDIPATVYFEEFTTDMAMWLKMPRNQLEKCAEAKALRRGWPEQFGSLYIPEEMQQADIATTTEKAQAPEPTPDQEPEVLPYCTEHQCSLERKQNFKTKQYYFAHKTDDGKLCYGDKKKADEPKDTPPADKPSEKTSQVAKTIELKKGVDWSKETQKDFLDYMVEVVQYLGWEPARAKKFLQDEFQFADSRAITIAKRNDIIAMLHDQIKANQEG
jgi:phage recombination protein Bet